MTLWRFSRFPRALNLSKVFFSRIGLKTLFYQPRKVSHVLGIHFYVLANFDHWELDYGGKYYHVAENNIRNLIDNQLQELETEKFIKTAVNADVGTRERTGNYYLNKIFDIGLHVSAVSLYSNFLYHAKRQAASDRSVRKQKKVETFRGLLVA